MILNVLLILVAIAAIYTKSTANKKLFTFLKPLTTILIIATIFVYPNFSFSTYTIAILTAMLFCLLGDIFLLDDKKFVFGIASFLIAHIFFTISFLVINGLSYNLTALVFLLVIGLIYYLYLKPDLFKYKIPVAVYFVAIIIMDWQAIGNYFENSLKVNQLLMIAAILFTFSDSVIAYNKFKKPFISAHAVILSTYWIAIFLFAKSTSLF